MSVTVYFTEQFMLDLAEIKEYSIRNWGRNVAIRYVREIMEAIDRIKSSPRILRLEPDLAPNLYFYRVKKHILVCDLRDVDYVTILSVIHTSMDLPARLAEIEPRIAAEVRLLDKKFRDTLDD